MARPRAEFRRVDAAAKRWAGRVGKLIAMESEAQVAPAFRRAGLSMIVYGTISLVGTIVWVAIYDSLMINFLDIVFIALGRHVRRGSVRATRWSIGILLVLLVGILLMIPIAAFWPKQLEWNGRSIELGQYGYAAATVATVSLWVVVTLNWLLEAIHATSRRWLPLALLLPIAFPIVLLTQVEHRAWQTNAEIERVFHKDVEIITVDAETNARLPFGISHEPVSSRGPNPKPVNTVASPSPSGISTRLQWHGLGEVRVGISSAGYISQQIILDQDSVDPVTVRLRQQK
jgi:hypothetical protein